MLIDSLRKAGALAADANPIQAALVFDSIALGRQYASLASRSGPATSRSMGVTKFELTLSLEIIDGQLKGHFEYNTALFDAGDHQAYGRALSNTAQLGGRKPTTAIGDLPCSVDKERKTLSRTGTKRALNIQQISVFISFLISRQSPSQA